MSNHRTLSLACAAAVLPYLFCAQSHAQVSRELTEPWVQLWWQWDETGQRPTELDGLAATTLSAADLRAPFREANVLFAKIYQDQVNALPHGETFVDFPTVFDLIRSDSTIREQYKEYTLTGKLVTPFDGDHNALLTHLHAIADAGNGGEFNLGGGFAITEDGVESTLLVATLSAPDGTLTQPPDVTPEPPTPNPMDIGPLLPDLICRSNLPFRPGTPPSPGGPERAPCPADDIPPNVPETPGSPPGFDCDDRADALGAWLVHHLRSLYPGITYRVVLLCPSPLPDPCNGCCHATLMLVYANHTWHVDASTGIWYGPISYDSCQASLTEAELKECVKAKVLDSTRELFCNLEPNPYNGDFCNGEYPSGLPPWLHPGQQPPGEPKPWHTDPERRAWLCAQLNIPAADCDQVLCWYIPGCENPQMPDGPTPPASE